MDGFPFATASLSADGSLQRPNDRWRAELPPVTRITALLHPVDALRLRNAVRLKARLQLRVRLHDGNQWRVAQALLSEQAALTLLLEPVSVAAAQTMSPHADLLGNVVHSFNNYLSAMMGFSELALLDVEPTHAAYGQLQTVLESGHQAVQFTRDLLAGAGRAVLVRKPFSLTAWLRRQLEQHGIPLAMTDTDCAIEADADWLARALDMTVAFLREAEPLALAAEFHPAHLSAAAASALQLAPGRYGVLTLRDRGRGLDEKHLSGLFAPYYSSKVVRGRKGLGLAPVAGIVRQHGGNVLALAETGEGCAIHCLLPLMADGVEDSPPAAAAVRQRAWLLTDLPWLAALADAQLAAAGMSVAAIGHDDAQSLLTDDQRPDLLLRWRLKEDGACAQLRQQLHVPELIWTPFADHRGNSQTGITIARFTPDGDYLRAAVSRLFP